MKSKKVFLVILIAGIVSLFVLEGSNSLKKDGIRIIEKIDADGRKIEKREYTKNGDIIRIVKYIGDKETTEVAYNRDGEIEKLIK